MCTWGVLKLNTARIEKSHREVAGMIGLISKLQS